MSGGGGNTTTIQRADPWGPSQPLAMTGLDDLARIYADGDLTPEAYTGPRVAGFGPVTQGVQNAMLANGNAATSAARGSLVDMMQGSGGIYRDMDAVRSEILGAAVPAAVSQFSGNGMTDSSVAMNEVGRAAASALAPFEYGAVRDARQDQIRAASLAPGIDASMFAPMAAVGAQQDAMSQAQLDADRSLFMEAQNWPYENLSRFSQLVMGYGGQGGASSATQPGASIGSQVGGAAATGLGLYGALAGAGMANPYAIPLAAGVGLLGLL